MFDYSLSAEFLKKCQVKDNSEINGTVCPWELGAGEPAREDLHDTLEAVYIWSRPENVKTCKENIELALDYSKRKFEWFKNEPEPLKSYDAIYYVLAITEYFKNYKDVELQEILSYTKEYLIDFFKSGPQHNVREYSNPYWKAVVFYLALEKEGQDTSFIRNWLLQDLSLPDPEQEIVHRGPGYQHPHDFASSFGTKLMAINTILPEVDYASLDLKIPHGHVKRSIDETSFNATLLYGLCTLPESNPDIDSESVKSTIEDIFSVLESKFVEGGTRRGDYVKIRESWTTFFVYFAELLREKKSII